jgi:hypothetical protein
MSRTAPLLVLTLGSSLACGSANPAPNPDGTGDAIEPAASTASESTSYGVAVDCRAVNTFGYVATVRGNLTITEHDWPSGFVVNGTLQVNAKMYGAPDQRRAVQVRGGVDKTGQYAYVNPIGTGDAIDQFNLVFSSSAASSVNAKDGTNYQSDCSHSVITLPKGADLALEHTMRMYPNGPGMVGIQIDVINVGNLPATGPSGRMRVGGQVVATSLHQYFGGTATAANTLNPGESGYLVATLPTSVVNRCGEYDADIDIDRTMQSGDPAPFGNDSGRVTAPCVRWDKPLTEIDLGYTPDPIVANKTLADIVSSKTIGRKSDMKFCNQCHFTGSSHPYSPPPGDVRLGQNVGGYTWAAGWAQQFVNQPDTVKPPYLKALFKQWVQDGAQ